MNRASLVTAFDDAGPAYGTLGAPFLPDCASLLLDRLDLRPGAALLDIACGPGTIALPGAARVGTSGSVIGLDLAERQLELARAGAPPGPRLRFLRADACAPGLPENSVDAGACGLGLAYFHEPLRAMREAVRITRSGGRLAWTCWGEPFFGRPGTRLRDLMARQEVGPALPFLTHTPDQLAEWAFRAGLHEVVIEEHDLDLVFPDFASWWAMNRAFACLVALDATAPETVAEVHDALAADPSLVDADGVLVCRMRVLLLHGAA